MFFDQQEFDIRFEWGEHGVSVLGPLSDAVIIVDVLSFSTSVEIAVHNGAHVYPFRWRDDRAHEFAASIQAELASPKRSDAKYSLSPASLTQIEPKTRLVLPSPNGARLSLAGGQTPLFAGCLRNAQAVALAASQYGSKIAVIAAGERWPDDHSLRPSFEDLIGAGSIIGYLNGRLSPEAAAAAAAFREARPRLESYLTRCSSGKELIERGFAEDVRLAAQLNASDTTPILVEGAFVRFEPSPPSARGI
jgi:2-phosphosulfolactate phosphatase